MGARVRLTFDAGRFLLHSQYADRHVAKQAGFSWNPILRVWWTTDAAIARRFVSFADPACRDRLAPAPPPPAPSPDDEDLYEAFTRPDTRAAHRPARRREARPPAPAPTEGPACDLCGLAAGSRGLIQVHAACLDDRRELGL